MRCKSPVEVFIGHSRGMTGIVPNLINLFGKQDGLDIMHYSRALFAATGEGVPYVDSTEWPHLGIESDRVEQALRIVGPISVDGQEADPKKTAQAGFSVEGCYGALVQVNTPDWYHQSTVTIEDDQKEAVEDHKVDDVVETAIIATPATAEPTPTREFSVRGVMRTMFWCFNSCRKSSEDTAENKHKNNL